jgi:DNA-binding phage protein
MRDSGDYDVTSIAKVPDVSRAAVYRALSETKPQDAA